MKDEKRATMPQSKVEYNYFIVFTKDLMDFSVEERQAENGSQCKL